MLDFEELGRWIGETDRRLRQLELMAVPAELRDRAPAVAAPATDAPMLRDLRDAASDINGHLSGKGLGATAVELERWTKVLAIEALTVSEGNVISPMPDWSGRIGRVLALLCCIADHTATPLRDVFTRAAQGAGFAPGSAGKALK
jgi:hypothetical protein